MTNMGKRPCICIVVSDLMTVKAFLQDQIRALSEFYAVTIVANTTEDGSFHRLNLGAELIPVSIHRSIEWIHDLRAFVTLYLLFRKRNFSLIHSITPKAGLLSMTAGWMAGTPVRVHTFTGQVWATASGFRRFLLKFADRFTVLCSTQILADSQSQLKFLIDESVVGSRERHVLANGSISGVELSRFRPDAAARHRIREEEVVPRNALIFLFVGRLNKDKGVLDLAKAFEHLAAHRDNAYLMFVGPDEAGLQTQIREICSQYQGRLRFVGPTSLPERYMAAADVICLPSYREGFGSVVIEAAATGIPAIASRIYGLTDAVSDGVTGYLHQSGDWEELFAAMETLAANRFLRERLGMQARERANRDFASEILTKALLAFYAEQLLAKIPVATKFARTAKRIVDLLLGIVALLMLSPLLVATAVVVRVLLGSPILFRQSRPGLRGELFTCLKFRTMTDVRDASGELLPDVERLTALGCFLRATSLDELPELINVIRGEMSLVGPRPLLVQYLSRYTTAQMKRHDVKPGITGWAQINGRNGIDWHRKFAFDLWYVEHGTFWLDLHILARTLWFVLRRQGIAHSGFPTMPEFMGVNAEHEKRKA
jgi:lipopolysaccharide/colanic/teichoic acid biosynthesis glycosyltransferase/glycosyltransferase involved in cell wall biosynthesis